MIIRRIVLLLLCFAITAHVIHTESEAKAPGDRAAIGIAGAGTESYNEQLPGLSPESDFRVVWQVIASGGGFSQSTGFYQNGVAGQQSVGMSMSDSFTVYQGYFQSFLFQTCVPGDANNSNSLNIDDIVYLLSYIFENGDLPDPDYCCGDADGSGGIDIDDVTYLIRYTFLGGPAPVRSC